jgi:hypothetical protein
VTRAMSCSERDELLGEIRRLRAQLTDVDGDLSKAEAIASFRQATSGACDARAARCSRRMRPKQAEEVGRDLAKTEQVEFVLHNQAVLSARRTATATIRDRAKADRDALLRRPLMDDAAEVIGRSSVR